MTVYSGPVFDMAVNQFGVIADHLAIPLDERDRLLLPKRAITISCPIHRDDGTVAVCTVHTGPSGLHQVAVERCERGQVELALGVPVRCPAGWQHAVGADHLGGRLRHDDQVVAVLVELVDVESGYRGVQGRAEFFGEDPVAQPLCGGDLPGVTGDPQRVARGAGFRRVDGENGHIPCVGPSSTVSVTGTGGGHGI